MFIPVTEEAMVSVETSFRTPKPTQGQEAIISEKTAQHAEKENKKEIYP